MASNVKYCPNCGTEVIPPAKFCQNCGTKLELSGLDCPIEEIPSFPNIKVGDIITFGKYIQNYDPEPIEWYVLDIMQGKALIISKYGLDMKPYHDRDADTNWEGSTIRWWLNGEFYHDSFTAQEKKLIIQSTIENKKRELFGIINDGDYTQDYVFLLSADESTYYFSETSDKRTRKVGETKATPWAVKNGAKIHKVPLLNSYYSKWWLRTPGKYGNDCAAYFDFTTERNGQLVSFQHTAVRPALWLLLEYPKNNLDETPVDSQSYQTPQIPDNIPNFIPSFLNVVGKFNSAQEIYEYILEFNSYYPIVFNNEIMQNLNKTVWAESMYGNQKEWAINLIKQYFNTP